MTRRFKTHRLGAEHPPAAPIPEALAMLDCVLMLRDGERFAIEKAPRSKGAAVLTEEDLWSVELDLQGENKRRYLCKELLLGLAATFQFLASRAHDN